MRDNDCLCEHESQTFLKHLFQDTKVVLLGRGWTIRKKCECPCLCVHCSTRTVGNYVMLSCKSTRGRGGSPGRRESPLCTGGGKPRTKKRDRIKAVVRVHLSILPCRGGPKGLTPQPGCIWEAASLTRPKRNKWMSKRKRLAQSA